jgi:excisionase family DNA binding protein
MKITLDKVANAGYIKISGNKINKTVSVSDYCNVDIDKEGAIVGIELLFINHYADDFKFWLGLSSTAAYLNKSPLTIRRWIQKGELPTYKIGREYLFVKEELDNYIKRQRQGPSMSDKAGF